MKKLFVFAAILVMTLSLRGVVYADKDGAVSENRAVKDGTASEVTVPTAYGLSQTAFPGLLEAHNKARNGLYACTANDKTHNAAVGAWNGTWLNDTYFGLNGMVFVCDAKQQEIYKAELEKVARTIPLSGPQAGAVPYCTLADGSPEFNSWWGSDYDRRCEFILEVVRLYEVSGDTRFLQGLLPVCRVIVENLSGKRDDPDQDLLLEGRSVPLGFSGVGSGASTTYIGDTVKNDWKDFGASMFFYHALIKLAQVEDILGQKAEATAHRQHAEKLKKRILDVFWSPQGGGFTAWIDNDNQRHEDWITGNNLHAVMCGLATSKQSAEIIQTLKANKKQLIDVVPGRVRIGLYQSGYCSNADEHYWNGGIWVLTTGPMMIALAKQGEFSLLSEVVDRLSNKTELDQYGFNECYDGATGVPENVSGLYMNNGGFLWGVFTGLYRVDFDGDDLTLRTKLSADCLPARAKLFYRGRNITLIWKKGGTDSVVIDGKRTHFVKTGLYRLRLPPAINVENKIEITAPEVQPR